MIFKPDDYFDIGNFPFKDIFDGVEQVWDVLPKIKDYTGGKLLQGEHCTIHPDASIREGVILGENVHIGYAVELKNCIILNNTHIAHFNYVGDAVIGSQVNVAGGAMLANFRLDKQPVRVKTDDGPVDTGLEKFSAVIGDGSSIGANSVLNPGTLLGKKTLVYPLVSVLGTHCEGSVIK